MSDNFESNQAQPNPESNQAVSNTLTVENNYRAAISQEMLDIFSDGEKGYKSKGIGHDIYQISDFPLRAVDVKIGRWINDGDKDFTLETNFGLQDNAFLDAEKTEHLLTALNKRGFTTSISVGNMGSRVIHIDAGVDKFSVGIGYPNKQAFIESLEDSIRSNGGNKALQDLLVPHLDNIKQGKEKIPNTVSIKMSKNGNNGELPFLTTDDASNTLQTFEEITEAVGTSLVEALSEGKKFESVKLYLVKPNSEELLRKTSNREILESLSRE